MPNYRRMFIPGGTWFFTVNLRERKQSFLTDNIDPLRSAFSAVKRKWPFDIDAIVILPDHLHAVLTLPEGDTNFSLRWRLIKGNFAKSIALNHAQYVPGVKRRERAVWQRRFWEHYIRDEKDFEDHIHYCYINPVKHKLVTRVKDWPYSSFHRDVNEGLVQEDWAGDASEPKDMGEFW